MDRASWQLKFSSGILPTGELRDKKFLVALASCDWHGSLQTGVIALFVHGATVFIGFRVFEFDRFTAARADRRIWGGLRFEHLGNTPSTAIHFGSPLMDIEPRALRATTLESRIRGLDYVSTAGATVSFSGRMAAHRLEIAILDAIRASDDVSTLILFSWNVRIRHGRPVAWISFSRDSETPQGLCFVG